jgi:hypothetical protein
MIAELKKALPMPILVIGSLTVLMSHIEILSIRLKDITK